MRRLVMVWLCVASEAWGAEPAVWQAGLASVKITPTEPVLMAGYANRTKPSQGVSSDLYAKALALQDEQGTRAVMVTADLINFRGDQAERICAAAMKRTGLERSQILLNTSHTHAGPSMRVEDEDRRRDPASAAATQRYIDRLESDLVELMARALAEMKPARLSWGQGVAPFVMNRREFTATGVKLGVNPRGSADRGVPVLRIESPEGRTIGVLFGTACHNTTQGGENLLIDGEYAGYAQQHVQQAMPGATAMFLLGCGGDANPYPRGTLELARQHGRTLGDEVLRVLKAKLAPVVGPLRTALQRVDLPLAPTPSMPELQAMLKRPGSWEQYVAARMIDAIQKGRALPTHYNAPLALWRFGDGLTIAAMSGETTSEYALLVERAIGPLNLWVAGYCNDVFGYLPSARILAEGGYETRGLIAVGVGLFAPEAEQRVIQTIQSLARQVGRIE
jgi:hypothetical protein